MRVEESSRESQGNQMYEHVGQVVTFRLRRQIKPWGRPSSIAPVHVGMPGANLFCDSYLVVMSRVVITWCFLVALST